MYIKREDIHSAIEKDTNFGWYTSDGSVAFSKSEVHEMLNTIPSADVAEVRHGKWIEKPHWVPIPWDCEPSVSLNPDEYDRKTHSEKQMWWHCSCCDYSPYRWEKPLFNFCPNCGADIRGET